MRGNVIAVPNFRQSEKEEKVGENVEFSETMGGSSVPLISPSLLPSSAKAASYEIKFLLSQTQA